jgi:N-acetylneuraminic acid mutarotase
MLSGFWIIIAIIISGSFGAGRLAKTSAVGSTIRINAGGGALNVGGVAWSQCYGVNDCSGWASNGYMTVPADPVPFIYDVAAPASQGMYQNQWTAIEAQFTFNITVTNGPYLVRLHFAELTKTAAYQRIFDVKLEGATVLEHFDLYALTRTQNTAIVREFPIEITDGAVTLDFLRQSADPTLSGIEIIPLATLPTSTPAPTALPGGTTSLFYWSKGATAPIKRFEALGAAVNGKLYVIGGFINDEAQTSNVIEAYDLASNTWQRLADMPEAISHAPVVVDGSTIYVLGGYVGDNPGPSSNRVWKFNTLTNTWSAGPDLPGGRGGAGAARIGRNIHFFGGATRTSGLFDEIDQSSHYVLNLDSGVWTTAASLPNPRNHMVGVSLNGKIYALGGQYTYHEESTNQAEVDVYDPASNTWARAADLPTPKGHFPASTFVVDGRIMIIGGAVDGGSNGWASDDVLVYDPEANVWLQLPPIPAYRKTPVAGLIGNKLVVATGGGYGPTDTTWVVELPETWELAPSLPAAIGEVAGGIIDNRLYLVGEGSPGTLSYNLSSITTPATVQAQRPFKGNHHTAEVYNGKLYLFGGLGNDADTNLSTSGKVQIFDPVANSWTLGADMPFAAGSSSSALIGGQIYVAGGIVNFSTTSRLARYNPVTNSWTELAAMPQGRNHAAAATDGSQLYILGGRGLGSGDDNTVANGFDTVQIYNLATNTWRSSLDAGSTLAPLPQARGGMGRAVYYNGEFYVLGGETLNGLGATLKHVYQRVDIYNPVTNIWRFGAALPTARHGTFPLLVGKRIYVGGGGTQAGYSSSALLEVYNPGSTALPATETPTATPTTTPSATPIVTPTAATPTTSATTRVHLPLIVR